MNGGLRIKYLFSFNDTFQSKFAWSLLTKESKKFSFLRDWYKHKTNSKFYFSSSFWPTVRCLQSNILSDSIQIIGMNFKVCFWTDNYLGEPLTRLVDLQNRVWDPNLLVSQVLNNNKTWFVLDFIPSDAL